MKVQPPEPGHHWSGTLKTLELQLSLELAPALLAAGSKSIHASFLVYICELQPIFHQQSEHQEVDEGGKQVMFSLEN